MNAIFCRRHAKAFTATNVAGSTAAHAADVKKAQAISHHRPKAMCTSLRVASALRPAAGKRARKGQHSRHERGGHAQTHGVSHVAHLPCIARVRTGTPPRPESSARRPGRAKPARPSPACLQRPLRHLPQGPSRRLPQRLPRRAPSFPPPATASGLGRPAGRRAPSAPRRDARSSSSRPRAPRPGSRGTGTATTGWEACCPRPAGTRRAAGEGDSSSERRGSASHAARNGAFTRCSASSRSE